MASEWQHSNKRYTPRREANSISTVHSSPIGVGVERHRRRYEAARRIECAIWPANGNTRTRDIRRGGRRIQYQQSTAVRSELEWNGIAVDTKLLGELSAQYGQRMATLEQEIYAEAGGEFNINSPKQSDRSWSGTASPSIRSCSAN